MTIKSVNIVVGPEGYSAPISLNTEIYMMVGGNDLKNVERERRNPGPEAEFTSEPGVLGDSKLASGGAGSFNLRARPADPAYTVVPIR